ncbi:polysaccharide pyruvyl transferase family protein [Pseudomonas deceptionensis]|uniref:Polysaccharide pyruvyl transferase n=1 Tax=Pseudomonas deceptionensis TaxID=882211 RepID=A0A0J6GFM2_PSEDM|nr:polysaccharide pyruvyl transferase family protein [Pseudomonas deceptionensis]KMM80724.1 hypothetical protein TR67_01040 [Pseudomonas deceptionensis]SEE92109.1 Polysaccharide pyruvyl transferase [Pseudomonas deceptionensis]
MKIGILTIHNSSNYGAVLQTFATQEYLKKIGQPEIINYKNTHTDKTMDLFRIGTGPRDLLRIGKDIFRAAPRMRLLKKFKHFFNNHYTLSGNPQEVLNSISGNYDLILCGSDQIWNPNIVNRYKTIDANYFLQFAGATRKLSYASSFGSHKFSKSEEKEVADHLKSFDSISVRESDSAKYLSLILNRPVSHVVDPTLLLDKDEWLSKLAISTTTNKRPYLLVYVLKKDAILKETVKLVSKHLNLDVVTIDQDPFSGFHCREHIRDAGPLDFIRLFNGASFIITNSFHGTAFSVNFNKPFIVTPPPTGANRILSLLTALESEEYMLKDQKTAVALAKKSPDFNKINKLLNILRENSKLYLKQAITESRK